MLEVELLRMTEDPEELCGTAAAICTGSENPSSALHFAIGSQHLSVVEHASFTFRVEGLSRAALAQLTRHRLASYSVQSQRYVPILSADLVTPESIQESELHMEVKRLMGDVLSLYRRLVDAGVPVEDARYVTPQAVPTNLIVTMNARELLHFFSLRSCNKAQWEIRELSDKMLKLCKSVAPKLFRNAGPGCLSGYCLEHPPCRNPRMPDDFEEPDEP